MINIYLDTTGSMTEMGKSASLKYVAKSIQDYCNYKSIENTFYKLDGEIIKELSSINFSNDLKINTNGILYNGILISDGLFELDCSKIFDVSIPLGIDADMNKMHKISKAVFESDNVLSALEYLIFQNSLVDNKKEGLEEDGDEWS